MWGADARGLFNTSRAWLVSYPGVSIKYKHNKTPRLPCPTTILTSPFHSIPLSQLPLSSHRSRLCCQIFFPSSNHFLPTALFWYSTVLFCSRFDSLAGSPQPLVISLPRILRHPLCYQTEVKRSTGWISHAWFSDSLSPFSDSLQLLWSPEIRKGSTGIISQPREWPVKCLLITLLCALSRTLSSDHTNRPPSSEMQSFTGAHYSMHSLRLSSRHSGVWTIVNNSDIPASLSKQTHGADGWSDNDTCTSYNK